MSTSASPSLATLPPELLLLILEDIHLDNSDMAAFCRISKRSYDVGIRVLYAYPVTLSLSSMVKLLKTIIMVPKLAKYVFYFTFDKLDTDLDIPVIFPSFLKLAARALRCMSSLCDLEFQTLPGLIAILHDHKFLRLTRCSLSITRSATPFLEAHSRTIQHLVLTKNFCLRQPRTERRLERNITFTRLKYAKIPLRAASLILPGTSAATVCLYLPHRRLLPPDLPSLAALSNVPVTTLELTIQRWDKTILSAVVQHAPTIRHLKVLFARASSYETISEAVVVDVCECISRFANLKRLEMRSTIDGYASDWRHLLQDVYFDEPVQTVRRLHASCRTLESIHVGRGIIWELVGGVWKPRPIRADHSDNVGPAELYAWMERQMAIAN
ncbi:hypothetical protein BD626DRAFT_261199 [Schizophyllum amplum]|uniref:F-box domain-containing protein n=1 Tax=Schizophyllum amplum TaxID=97359 RepID=A0A550CG99_9AGAR|nr:hypothetical protein BD626DRAFT_261199 [Auriculariopsis ampla]